MQGDFRLDQWLVQPRLNTVVDADNRPVQLGPKVIEVLVYLADHAGEVISKDTLLRELWKDTFVTENALTRCIAELRRIFHDETSNPRIIQTIAKKGYRLIAHVSRPEPPVHAGEQPAPPPAVPPKPHDMQAQLQNRIPPSLAEKMHLAEKDLDGENRLVTALFIDLSGISTGSPGLPADSAVEKVNRCLSLVAETVYRYEGSINRFIGDCVLAFFGAPLAHENDPERAVRAALEMRSAVSGLGLSFSAGINTGMTYFGPIGTERHPKVGAHGLDVNLAKRLEEAAKPGQILVGAGTHRLTRKAFDYVRLEPLSVKGVEAPVPAYEAVGVAERPEKLRGIEGLRARMIGREREFADLKQVADHWLSGQGQMVSVIGDAGIGKSRLVAELKAYLTARDIRCLEGRCVSIGQPISYWPFLDILRSYFGLSHADSEADLARKVAQVVTSLFPKTANEILPFLGRLLSLRFGGELDSKLDYFTPEQVRNQTMTRLRDLFETLARSEPLLLVLEDLHWADDLSLDLISLLMDSLKTTPLMLVCVYRPERESRCRQLSSLAQRKAAERYTEISLKQLTRQQSQELIEELLAIQNLPECLKGITLRKSEGNPFFIEEVIRSLIDRDLVYREAERWKARAEISDIDVPDTIQEVVQARVDCLQAEARTVLQYASVIGRLFKYQLLQRLSGKERDLDPYLKELEEKELVYEERTVPEPEYTFKHAFTQQATYQGIPEKRRREFHLQVAREMERLYGDRLEECYEELAHHYSRSDDVEKAVEYLQKSGEKAVRTCAYENAIAAFRKGIERVGELADTTARSQREADLQAALGWVLITDRGFASAGAEQAFSRTIELCERLRDDRRCFWALAGLDLFHQARAEYDKQRDAGQRCLELAQKAGDMALVIFALDRAAINSLHRGETVNARSYFEQALSLYDPQKHRSLMFITQFEPALAIRVTMACVLWFLGYPDRAIKMSREAVTDALELLHPPTLVQVLCMDGALQDLIRNVEAARQQWEKARQLSAEVGLPSWLVISNIYLGWCQVQTGQLQDGIARISNGLVDYQAQGLGVWQSYMQALLAWSNGKRGQICQGLELLDDGLAFVEKRGEGLYEAELHRIRGELLLMQGKSGEAPETSFRKAIDVARRQQAKSWELRATTSLSRLLQKQGRNDEARRMLGEIYNWFTEGFDTADLKDAKALLDLLA